jgi:hypothetical protein
MVTDRQRQCEFVDWFVVKHREVLVGALVQLFQRDAGEGQPVPDVVVFVDALVLRLRRAFAELKDAEERHNTELANDGVNRERRDVSEQSLRDVMTDWRSLFRVTHGLRKAAEVGFERRIASHPLAMLRQADRILTQLKDPELVHPATEGVAVTHETTIAKLDATSKALRQAMDDLTGGLTKTAGALVAKDAAMEHFDEVYRLFVNLLRSAFRLAGKHELANRLTLRLSRRSRRSDNEQTSPEAPEPAAPADPEPQP